MALLSRTQLILGLGLAALANAASQPQAVPLYYAYGGYPRIQTNITWGTPPQNAIPTIFDTGSVGFWVYGQHAIINDGSQYHYTEGPCNKSVKDYYNYKKSSTSTDFRALPDPIVYAYGGNGKLVSAYDLVNDTMGFLNGGWPALTDQEVALANFTIVTQLDKGCKIPESSFDHSIMGLAPFGSSDPPVSSTGPSFRYDLFNQGKTASHAFSMWMDKPFDSVQGTYFGAALFGALPGKNKYTGELVRVTPNPPKSDYIGYYVSLPNLTAASFTSPGSKPTTIGSVAKSVKRCLLDSGTAIDSLPFDAKQLAKVSDKVIQYHDQGGSVFTAWNGSCFDIPRSAVLNYTFAGSTKGKSVTIGVPIRSYVRGIYDDLPGINLTQICPLSLSLSEEGCTFGAPFFTAAFLVFDDDVNQIAMAQGGVSTGSTAGISSLGSVTTIPKGGNIPGSV